MHAFKLAALLDGLFWWELRDMSRELGLRQDGGRRAIAQRVMDMHAEPALSAHVGKVALRVQAGRPAGSKRRKVRDKHSGVANLEAAFEAVAAPPPRADETIDAALDTALCLDDDDATPIGPVVVVGQPTDADVARAARDSRRHGLVFYPRSMCIDRE